MSLHIDGSMGEGGGQVLRTAAGLAARTGTPITVDRIRQGRSKPGLRPQHAAALKAVAQACHGELDGVEVGSQAIAFTPGELTGGTVRVDTGTAANTTLILQALLPLAPALPEPLVLDARGGTDTKWAPTLVFLRDVLAPLAARAGVTLDLVEARHGFYPKGGGRLQVRLHPAKEAAWPGVLSQRGSLQRIQVTARTAQLPDHVPERVLESCLGALEEAGYTGQASADRVEAMNPGVVVDAVAGFEHTVLGANQLGEKGVPSETVGQACARMLIAELDGPGTVDVHAADQLVPLLYDVPGAGFVVRELTGHLETNLALVDLFLPGGHRVDDLAEGVRVLFGRGPG